MPDPVTLNFVSDDVLGGEWLQWANGFTSVTDLVDQAIARSEGAPIERIVIAQHGAVGTHGFVCLDVNQSEIIDGSSGTFNEIISEQLGRLEGHWAEEAIIEMRVCEFGTELNGTKAMQLLADAAGVPVTAPTDEIKSLGLVGGLTTNWKTVYPSSWDRPMEVSFWRGEPEEAPSVPLRPADVAAPQQSAPDGPTSLGPGTGPVSSGSGGAIGDGGGISPPGSRGFGSLTRSRGFQAASAGIAIALIIGVVSLGPDDTDSTDVDASAVSEPAPDEPATEETASDTGEPGDEPDDEVGLGSDLYLVPELPLEVRAEYVWEPTRCDVLPEGGDVDIQPQPGTLGASIQVSLGIRGLLGGDTFTLSGGGGGTIERDGVVTKVSTVAELVSINDDGFTALIEELEGEADENGEFVDTDAATCLEGGTLTVRLDPTHWSQWVSMPRLDESLLEVGKEPTCLAEPDGDSILVYFGTSLAGPAIAPKVGSGKAEVRYYQWLDVPLVVSDASMDSPQWFQLSSEGETVQPPADLVEMYRDGGIVGGLRFTPEQGVDNAEPVDLALQFRYGIFGAFTWSVICDWAG
jgi:hypothetical protein